MLTEIAPRYKDRPGGYTRVWKLGTSHDDNRNQMAFIELVGSNKDLRKQFTELAQSLSSKAVDQLSNKDTSCFK